MFIRIEHWTGSQEITGSSSTVAKQVNKKSWQLTCIKLMLWTNVYRRFSSQLLSIFFCTLHALICSTAGNVYFCTQSSPILLAEWDVPVKMCSKLWQIIIRREESHSPLAFPPFSFIASSFQLLAPFCVASFWREIKNSQRFANAKIRCEEHATWDNFPRNDCCEANCR